MPAEAGMHGTPCMEPAQAGAAGLRGHDDGARTALRRLSVEQIQANAGCGVLVQRADIPLAARRSVSRLRMRPWMARDHKH